MKRERGKEKNLIKEEKRKRKRIKGRERRGKN